MGYLKVEMKKVSKMHWNFGVLTQNINNVPQVR